MQVMARKKPLLILLLISSIPTIGSAINHQADTSCKHAGTAVQPLLNHGCKINTISEFLAEARKKLTPYNVFIAADIFGYVAWNADDTQIGQKIDHLAPSVDYISLMLYPSGFRWGIPGYRNPVANPNKIVYLSLKRAQERTDLPSLRFRPWIQGFTDYAFDRRHFSSVQIRDQIQAAEDFGADGWMLWNPRNIYSSEGLKKKFERMPN